MYGEWIPDEGTSIKLLYMPRGWNKGLTKDSNESVRKISETMKARKLDNFKKWRDEAKRNGSIKSEYLSLEKNGDLAELIGVVLGDGHIYRHQRCESLRITGDAAKPEFVYRSRDLVVAVFSKEPTMAKVKASNAMTVTIYEKHISDRLGIPCGSRANLRYLLPEWIRVERAFRIRFLRGLYEAEGSRCHHAPSYTYKLLFRNMNPHLLTLVAKLVNELGFKAIISSFQVQVSRRHEVQNLADLLQFRHYES